MTKARLATLTQRPLIVPMKRPFGIAGGAQDLARNILVSLTLTDGTLGLGEAAPFPAASGETFESTWEALVGVHEILARDPDLSDYRRVCATLGEALIQAPAALCAVEMALFDALTRRGRQSLLAFFGGKGSRLTTDITIVTGTIDDARDDARDALAAGFSTLKLKVGGTDLDADAARLRAVHHAAPRAALVLDANAAYSSDEALQLLLLAGPARAQVALFEQPVAADNLEGLARVEREGRVRVAADESLRSREDFSRLVKLGGVSAVNIKTAKLGVLAAWDLLLAARAAGLAVMVGGMVETELAMSTSACLAAGAGEVEFIDLDTPLFMGARPLSGGFAQAGPHLDLGPIKFGHGVSFVDPV